MTEIVPALVEQSFAEIRRKLELVDDVVNWVQIDIVDNLFAPGFTWDDWRELETLVGRAKVEIHLMTERPEHEAADWARMADRVIVHLEATERLDEIIKRFEKAAAKLGVAVLLSTPLEKLEPYAGRINFIQLMSIAEIGHQGEPFAPAVINRVRTLRAKWPDVTIAIDGGVNLTNAPDLIAAGANNLVVGSAIWKAPDPLAEIKKFQQLLA